MSASRDGPMAVIVKGQSIRWACADLSISETCCRYQPKQSGENARIAENHLRTGCVIA
jgi:hypothetical protein